MTLFLHTDQNKLFIEVTPPPSEDDGHDESGSTGDSGSSGGSGGN